MPYKQIACLAASLKNKGFCYAGKDLVNGRWVRPISNDPGHGISAFYRVVGKGDPAKVGDVLHMNLGADIGAHWQMENVEHRPEHWRRMSTFSFDEARAMIDHPASVWGGGRSTSWGVHDELSEAGALGFDHSLLLIEVDDLEIACRDEGYGGETKVMTRADFSYAGTPYRLPITDPEHFHYEIGDHLIGHALLCCSLAESYTWKDGSRHVSKLVASVITRERLG